MVSPMIIAETSTREALVRDGLGKRLDGDVAGDVLEDAALLDAGSVLDADELDRDVGLDLLGEVDLLAVEVHQVAADRVTLLLLDDDRDLAGALDLEVEQGVALVDEERELMRVGLKRPRRLAAGVDDAGHETVAAQASRRARAELGAVGYLENGA